jgi:hypothetical protein
MPQTASRGSEGGAVTGSNAGGAEDSPTGEGPKNGGTAGRLGKGLPPVRKPAGLSL